MYQRNYKSIKQRIDKGQVIKRLVGKGKAEEKGDQKIITTFASINDGKDYLEVDGWSFNGNFGIYEDPEEDNKYELLRKTREELNKYKKPIENYELETSFIMKNEKLGINENFTVGDIVMLYNPYFFNKGIEQKVLELEYNPLLPWKNPKIVLGEKQTQLVEFLQNQTKEISKLKRRLTS